MRTLPYILSVIMILLLANSISWSRPNPERIEFDFYGTTIQFEWTESQAVPFPDTISEKAIVEFLDQVSSKNNSSLLQALSNYHASYQPDDWLFYQLIRKAAQHISAKYDNYARYTLYKWYLLQQMGYQSIISISASKILFYIQTDETIYNIPARMSNGKQYVCLNFHDYPNLNITAEGFHELALPNKNNSKGFTYKVTHLPIFSSADYQEKDIRFRYYQSEYQFKVKVNPEVQKIFANYPVVDYEYQFNIPMSSETYQSLLSALKKNLQGKTVRNGVDYLMRFTRYAFLYRPDSEVFGDEKRLSAEQTLLYNESDCDDRAALFFYLVKELYNLPMLVVAYPQHVTIAVQLDKPIGKPIVYNGAKFTICEPTPQKEDLGIGQMLPSLRNSQYEIAYVYQPEVAIKKSTQVSPQK